MERRRLPRYQVQCHSLFTAKDLLADGVVTDLSEQGCRVASTLTVQPGSELVTRIQLRDGDAPIEIPRAEVRWSRFGQFGLKFLVIEPTAFETIRQFLSTLPSGPIG